MSASTNPWDDLREVLDQITDVVAEHLRDGESALEYPGEPESAATVPEHLRTAFQKAAARAVGDHTPSQVRRFTST